MKRSMLVFLLSILLLPCWAQTTNYRLLVGTYTSSNKSKGIYIYDVNMATGKIIPKTVAVVDNPSYLAVTPDKKFVYSVNQNDTKSTVSAFRFDADNSKLTFLNKVEAKGEGPCFISTSDKHVFTANYTSGSLSVFGRNEDGTLTNALQVIQHVGKSMNAERQGEPHVHQVILSQDKKYLLANDLGTDKVTVYKYDPNATSGILVPFDTLSVQPGSGPRHSAFSKDGSKLYLIHEIDGTLSVLGMKNGKLKLLQESSVVKKDKIVNRAADIHLSPDGKYLYATNRGTANDISCFSVGADGLLTFIQQVSTGGSGPRNFAITPDGQYVFVAHQESDTIVLFKRDAKTGKLTVTDKKIEVGSPVCLVFY